MGECQQQKHIQNAPFMKMECNYLYGWIKKKIVFKQSHKQTNLIQRWWTPETIAGNTEEEEET